MYNRQENQSSLSDPKAVEDGQSVGHGIRCQDEQDKNHRVDQMKVLLKEFVLD